MKRRQDEPHLSDDDLRLLWEDADVDGTAPEGREHLVRCHACQARSEWLRRREDALERRLLELEAPPAARHLPATLEEARRGRAGWPSAFRWAAAVGLLVVGSAVVAGPARAGIVEWVSARLTEVAALLGGANRNEDVDRATIEAPGETDYLFMAREGELRLDLATHQAEGRLIVAVTDDAAAALTVIASGSPEPVLVLPDRLEIRNRAGSTSSYRLTVPRHVRVLYVRTGGTDWSPIRTGSFRNGEEHAIPLAADLTR